MKKTIIVSFLMFYGFMRCQESIKVIYETVSIPQISFNGHNVSESMKEEMKINVLQKAKEPKRFTLYYDKGNSFFHRGDKEDQLSEKQKTEYYRLKNKEGIYLLNDFVGEAFYGYYPMDNVVVEFMKDEQTIENFNCKLALYRIGNMVSKVWYTEDIPISAGPYNYYKLPGLILKVESPNFLCHAVRISKDFDQKYMKKMDPRLKTYEGEELKTKIADEMSKMRQRNQQNVERMKENLKGK